MQARLRPLVSPCRLRSKSPSAYFVCQGGCLDASQPGALATEALSMQLGQCRGRAGRALTACLWGPGCWCDVLAQPLGYVALGSLLLQACHAGGMQQHGA